ncbi:hypothetical protein ABVT39_007892 [Epinephelus coioides]
MKISSFPFVLHLHTLEKILGTTFALSEQLQTQVLVIPKAAALIRSTKAQLDAMRSEDEWNTTMTDAKAFARKMGPCGKSSIGQREGDQHKTRFSLEFTQRLTENENLLDAIQAFDMSSPKFLEVDSVMSFASAYEIHIDTTVLQSQCQAAKALVSLTEKDDDEDVILSTLNQLNSSLF